MKDIINKIQSYSYIVGYGVGQYYDYVKTQIPQEVHLDFLCDAMWQQIGEEYNGIKVISPDNLKELTDVFVIVFSGNQRNWNSICAMLDSMRLPYIHIDHIMEKRAITGKELKQTGEASYCDRQDNRIEFFDDMEDSITVSFLGGGNHVKIGRHISTEKLHICCGSNAVCTIGDGTEIEAANLIVTNGSIEIGADCLFSYQVTLRNHDTHHIFDRDTGKRINYPGNIKIGNHVWIGYGATLLGNASIGDNSIVGSMAVTSSSFPNEVVIAGNPARIIREHVCWSKDNTNFYNRDSLEECLAKEAMKYF